ncbi:MAG: hypothetical protein ABSG84_10630 [Acidobacteriaceae bacterium]
MRGTQTAFGVVVLMLAASWTCASAQGLGSAAALASGTQPQVVFAFERQGLSVPRFRFTIHSDGSAVYEGDALPVSIDGAAAGPAQPFRREVNITPATADRIFALGRKLDRFNITCASRAKNIADTGTKTLSYTAPDGAGSCTYNYSENKDVQTLTETFQGMAETMDEGRQLDFLRRYDRLGLDDAMTFLAQEVTAGRALEVGTIAASLRSIADDADVMQRVRVRARTLLALVPAAGEAR